MKLAPKLFQEYTEFVLKMEKYNTENNTHCYGWNRTINDPLTTKLGMYTNSLTIIEDGIKTSAGILFFSHEIEGQKWTVNCDDDSWGRCRKSSSGGCGCSSTKLVDTFYSETGETTFTDEKYLEVYTRCDGMIELFYPNKDNPNYYKPTKSPRLVFKIVPT
jgi:hypothetical protein